MVFRVEEAPTTTLYIGMYVFQAQMPAYAWTSKNEI
jgi:hypothetical protein